MNQVILEGNVAADAEVRAIPSGKTVARFRVATSEGYGEKKTTQFHTVIAWEEAADEASAMAKKGTRVLVIGRQQTRTFLDKRTNTDREVTEVVARSVWYRPRVVNPTQPEPRDELADLSF